MKRNIKYHQTNNATQLTMHYKEDSAKLEFSELSIVSRSCQLIARVELRVVLSCCFKKKMTNEEPLPDY